MKRRLLFAAALVVLFAAGFSSCTTCAALWMAVAEAERQLALRQVAA